MPLEPSQDLLETDQNHNQQIDEELVQDEPDLHLETPSSRANGRPGKRSPVFGAKRIGKWKTKGKPRLQDGGDGECYLLGLPEDVLQLLLSRLPPKTLLALSLTCKILNEELRDESIWRGSYVNRYFWDGASTSGRAKEEVRVLVQGCTATGGKGWKKEALSREAMLDRWVVSKTSMIIHHPPVGLIHSLSLSYPPFMPSTPKKLVVGKTHSTPNKATSTVKQQPGMDSSPGLPAGSQTSSPSKLTHRQQYEALLAATTRSPPHILSAGLAVGGVVRSDPISGKVSKGFWGPGRDANFHLRPHLDHFAPPSAIFLSSRQQTHVLWGLLTGSCVHTTIQSRNHATHGGRASSLNVRCESSDAHDGEIRDISAPQTSGGASRWVTAGADGKVKYWQLNAGQNPKSGKRSPAVEVVAGSITCLFTSSLVDSPPSNRSDTIKRRQTGAPDSIVLARCDIEHDVVCGVTEDGDLRIWFGASTAHPREVRLDVGSAEEFGGVKRLELDVRRDPGGLIASVLVHHNRSPSFVRYDITESADTEPLIKKRTFAVPSNANITALQAHLNPTPPISSPPRPLPALSAKLSSPGDTPDTMSPPPLDLSSAEPSGRIGTSFGRFVTVGDDSGIMWIWAWDGDAMSPNEIVQSLRAWPAMSGKITSIDVSCGLVAVGSFDGYIKIFDPLPLQPTLLRTFHASHLSPADALIAASPEFDALYYTVNQIILENDLVVASIGRKVFAWRAGTGKGRQDGKGGNKGRLSGGNGDFKGKGRTLDLKTLHQDAADSHTEIREYNAATRVPTSHEQQHIAAMEDLGLDDGDDAVQYALMLSMEERDSGSARQEEDEHGSDEIDDDEVQALRAVEEYSRAEEDEMREVMRMIKLAEEKEVRAITP